MDVHKGDVWFYARAIPKNSIYEVCELKIRTVTDDYIVGIDKHDKHAYLLSYNDIDKTIFKERTDALNKVLKVESDNERNL